MFSLTRMLMVLMKSTQSTLERVCTYISVKYVYGISQCLVKVTLLYEHTATSTNVSKAVPSTYIVIATA